MKIYLHNSDGQIIGFEISSLSADGGPCRALMRLLTRTFFDGRDALGRFGAG